ncbi:MAG: (2Fe-2S) ferredoxin domain-containing protein, partial [Comamonadaceae bacterium]|nr:(2Fe-2S) ferredoxin domain-containing protein [Comamonadaceae bacterium]
MSPTNAEPQAEAQSPSVTNHEPRPLGVVVLGRGGSGAAAREQLQALAEQLRAQLPGARIAIAFADRASPSLPEALTQCLPCRQIIVLPLLLPGENALLRWLEKVARRWRHQQASAPEALAALPPIVFAPGIWQQPALPELLARQIAQAQALPDVTQTTPERWQHDPAAWSTIPPHQRHALLCLGPRCTALGAAALWPQLTERLRACGKLQRGVMALQTSCQYPCNHGPLLIVYPEGIWYGRLDEDAIAHIVDEHLQHGRPLAQYRIHRTGEQPPGGA